MSDKLLIAELQQIAKWLIGENKIKTTVDDILNMLSTIDEKSAFDALPVPQTSTHTHLINRCVRH